MSGIVGRGWAFPVNLDERDRITLVEKDEEIKQAIFIILNTAPGERVMRPEFGCSIHELLFWPANNHTAAIAERFVTEALKRWEPRIDLKQVRAYPYNPEGGHHPTEPGMIVIEIDYQIKTQHDVRSLVYPFYVMP
jgi:hypothetical protein